MKARLVEENLGFTRTGDIKKSLEIGGIKIVNDEIKRINNKSGRYGHRWDLNPSPDDAQIIALKELSPILMDWAIENGARGLWTRKYVSGNIKSLIFPYRIISNPHPRRFVDCLDLSEFPHNSRATPIKKNIKMDSFLNLYERIDLKQLFKEVKALDDKIAEYSPILNFMQYGNIPKI